MDTNTRFIGQDNVCIIERSQGELYISGMAVVYYDGTPATEYIKGSDGRRLTVERIERGAFDESLSSGHDVVAVYDHDPKTVLGRISSGDLELRNTPKGIEYSIKYDPTDPDHQRVLAKINRRNLKGSSFKASYRRNVDDAWIDEPNKRVNVIRRANLEDVSPCSNPCYPGSTVALRSLSTEAEAKEAFEAYETFIRLEKAKNLKK